jgi:phosphate:Na+ symporter
VDIPFSIIGSLLGGLGLFLLAVGMMTDGLRQTAGASLRKILSDWTNTPFKGVLSGFFMTAIVQSSSAVTVASIGFVNAGLLSMRQALGIVYGANVGTTITGWLVAFVGFKLNIQAFALPLIGIGMAIRLMKPNDRVASLGMALVGFGLFFVGVGVLKESFEGVMTTFDISKFTSEGFSGILMYLAIGFVMTILTQSSSASIALTITAAVSGLVELQAAAAMVIGANVGTTSTAALASIGATANAKRVALAQVIFNIGTGLVALLVMPLMFLLIDFIDQVLNINPDLGLSLALFHTVFNVLGVALVFPLNNKMAVFLENCFIAREEKLSLPKYLDKTIAETPVIAVNALALELQSIAHKVSHLCTKAFGSVLIKTELLHSELLIIRHLSTAVSKFIVTLKKSSFSEDTSKQLATILRIDQYLLSCANYVDLISKKKKSLLEKDAKTLNKIIGSYQSIILGLLQYNSENRLEDTLVSVQLKHDQVKSTILKSGAEGNLSFETVLDLIDLTDDFLTITQQWLKALKYLQQLQDEIGSEISIEITDKINGREHSLNTDIDPIKDNVKTLTSKNYSNIFK